MPHHPEFTPVLMTCLQAHPGQKFTASDLKEVTRIPKKFVRRALTDDPEHVAEHPMPGVKMEWKIDRWYYWWDDQPPISN
jgi:hypothetical protein